MPANPTDHALAGGSVSTRIPVDVARFGWLRRLAIDYAHRFSALAPFYNGDPATNDAWAQLIRATRHHVRARARIASIVERQQIRRRAPDAAVASARRLAADDTVAVVTGQQAGLFGGPLFTLLKALTAVQLADRVEREHQVPCVPIFWIDAEDHDWDEVRACTALDESLVPQRVELPPRGADATEPVGRARLDQHVNEVLAALRGVLPPTEFTAELMDALTDVYAPGAGMAEAFGRWLERLLGHRGLVVFDASDPDAKPLSTAIFSREVATAGETSRRAIDAGAELTARGYHAQVQPSADALALFALDAGRQPIRLREGRFRIGDRDLTAAELESDVVSRPAAYSPNVLLRPIVQDTLFPTICYVAGPNELAYLGQLRGVYAHFGVPMPLMYPRTSATVLDAASLRFLTRYDLAFESLQPQDDSVLNALLKAAIPESVEAAFRGVSDAVASSMAAVIARIPGVDPTLESTARSTLGRMQHDLESLHAKMIQAAKRRDETLRRQFGRARALAFPRGQAQERALGMVWFLNQFGPALTERLEAVVPVDLGRHWVVTI